jgi:GR25 family glycosyltransferase involved in LPS biosynthesis
MEIKIIHYSKLTTRIRDLLPVLEREDVTYKIISDFNPEELTSLEINKFDKTKIKLSEISIFMKHIHVLTSSKGLGNIIVVEDDIEIINNFKKKLSLQINKLPNEYSFLFFDQFTDSFSVKRNLFNFNKKFYKVTYFSEPDFSSPSKKKTGKTRGLAGYVFNSKFSDIIRKEFESQENICIPIDHWLNHLINKYSLDVFWSQPPLSFQGSKTGKYKSETTND